MNSGWTDRWMDGWMNGWVDSWVDGWMDGCMDGWMDGLVDGWMNQQTLDPTSCHCLFTTFNLSGPLEPRKFPERRPSSLSISGEPPLRPHRLSDQDISAVWGYQGACLPPKMLALCWDKVDRTGAAHCPFGGSQTHCCWVCFGAGCERAVSKHEKLPTLIPPLPDFPKQDQQVHCPRTLASHQNALNTWILHVYLLVTVTHCLTLLRR